MSRQGKSDAVARALCYLIGSLLTFSLDVSIKWCEICRLPLVAVSDESGEQVRY